MPLPALSSVSLSLNLRVAHIARRVGTALPHFAHTLLPNLCALCGNLSQQVICTDCDAAYWNEARLRCRVCAVPLGRFRHAATAGYRCGDCVAEPPSFDATFALADYRPPLDALATGLKFGARLMLAREFASRLARVADDALEATALPDLVVPVPLARRRLVQRGYNQAWEIAKPFARALQLPADPTLLVRTLDTAPQSRLDRAARHRNVGTAFVVTKPVSGLHVAVVDDVMTSGATLDALARALKTAGAQRVTGLVALRTPQD
ncbi:double zinc ribbon domain-containing protein [Paraburkholderia megapolitana]|uniref:double zinc ribbon domain-containing protein n=1 Tax=Paraburkholderia megapolitana TaxID=420953 RepID=UPI0038B8AFD7